MLVMNPASVSSIADLKAHSKNLLKTLEIAHHAFIVSDVDYGSGIPNHFALKTLKNSHIQEFLATTLGFFTYAALQAKVKEEGINFKIKDFNTEILSQRIKKTMGTEDSCYSDFLAYYFNEYLRTAHVLIEEPENAVELPQTTALSKFLPLLSYLVVKPFNASMRAVVEESLVFIYTDGNRDGTKLTTDHRFPLDGWIEVTVLNNLLEECAEPVQAGYEKIKTYTHNFFYGTPRISQRKSIYSFLNSTSRIGSEYYTLDDEVLNWDKRTYWHDLNRSLETRENHKVEKYELVFEILPRLKAILQNYVPSAAAEYVFSGTYSMSYDLYGIQILMDKHTPKVINARIYEATEYYLSTCRHHLKDLNPVLHFNKLEAFLSVRDPSVNELCWRRQVCDYAENMINAAKFLFEDYIVTKQELDLKKVFFNDFGFLMFDLEEDITFGMYSLGYSITLSPYNFSIFFNFLASILYIKYGNLKQDKPYLLALTYLNFLTLKDLKHHPVLKHFEEMFDLKFIEELFNLSLKKYDDIGCKFEHANAEIELVKDGSKSKKTLLMVCPKGVSDEAVLLRSYQLFQPEITALELLKRLQKHKIENRTEVKVNSDNKLKVLNMAEIPLDGAETFMDLDIKSRESHLNALTALGKNIKHSEIFDFADTLEWLAAKLENHSYQSKKAAIDALKESNIVLYVIMSYLLNRPTKRPEIAKFDDIDYKTIAIMSEKEFH